MATLAEIRKQYPQYGDMSDQQLADALYSRFYSDMDRGEFDRQVGLRPGWAWQGSIGGLAYDAMNVGKDAQGYTPSAVPFLDPINAFANQAVDSIPIIGPSLSSAGNQVDAWFNNALGFPEQTAEDRAAINAGEAERFPIAAGAGTVTGSVAPLVALAMTPAGGAVLGTTGSMIQRALMGGLSGSVIGAGDSAARGGDIVDNTVAGLLGAGIGVVSPIAERVVSPVVRALLGRPNPGAAQRSVAQTLENSGIDPRDLPRLLDELGPDALPVDLSRQLTQQGGGIASVPGPGGQTMADALLERHLATNPRIQGDVDALLGVAPIPSRLAAEITANQKALGPAYDVALEGAKAVDTSGIALTLDSMIVNERGAAQQAAQNVRRMLNISGTDQLDPNPQTLLNTRHAIDGILYTDTGTAPLDSNVVRVLQQARRDIDAELTAKVPNIKEVDRQYAELASQKKAVGTGQELFDTGRNTVTRPAELEAMMQADPNLIVGPSGVPFRLTEGARAEIDRIIGTTGNDITALKKVLIGEGSWNRDKLAQLYGKEKADQLVGILNREQRYANSYNRILQNSETAARTASQQEAMPPRVNLDIQKIVTGLPEMAVNAAARGRSQATNAQIAEILANRPTPELVDQLIAARAANRGYLGSSLVPLLTGP